IHPLVHENTSDLSRQRFTSVLSETEDFFYSVNESSAYLPESAHLEMARVAAGMSVDTAGASVVIKDVEWHAPIMPDGNVSVNIALYQGEEDEIEWEIYSQTGKVEEEAEISSEGKAGFREGASALKTDLRELRARFPHINHKRRTASRHIEEVWTGDGSPEEHQFLIKFKKPDKGSGTYKEPEVLIPGVLEACLEAVHEDASNGVSQARLSGIKEMEIPAGAGHPVWGLVSLQPPGQNKVDIALYDESGTPSGVITGLAYVFETPKKVSADQYEMMTFEEAWREEALTMKEQDIKTVVVFLTDESRRQAATEKLKELGSGVKPVFIGSGTGYKRESENRYTIRLNEKSDYAECLKEIKSQTGNAEAIWYMWPTEDADCVTDPSGMIYMLQGLAAAGLKTGRVMIAGGYRDGLERCHTESWIGIERSAGLVMPGSKVNVICADLKETSAAEWAETMWKELHAEKAESVLYEDGLRKVSRISPVQTESSKKDVLKEGGVYLITGGAGGLGMIFSRWLADAYKAKLILVNRSSIEDKKGKLEQLQNAGAEVMYYSADVCNAEEMKQAVQAGKSRFGHIDGVIHAAGIEGGGSILEKEIGEYLKTLEPKVQGTLALEEALQGEHLDFICYFSSSSAIIGDFGNCDYAVGNRFLMSYGAYRNARYKGKTVVVNWPLWKSEGMGFADEQSSRMYLKSSGQRLLESTEGTEVFEAILRQKQTQWLVMTGNRKRVYKFLGLSEETRTKTEVKRA
ncbi:SDR family oxidoreductase, partial [Bacillus velezensis]